MKIPKIIYSDKKLNTLSPFMKIGGIALYPYIILREKYRDNSYYRKQVGRIIRHETIHIKQQQEMLVIPFYIWYFMEWFIRLFINGKSAYRNISFEKEAKFNEENPDYLETRKPYSWMYYF